MPDLTELTYLRRLLAEGTQGPWERVSAGEISGGERLWDDVISPGPVSCMSYCYGGSSAVEMTDADSALIVAAVNALPDLLDAAEALERVKVLYERVFNETPLHLVDRSGYAEGMDDGRDLLLSDLREAIDGEPHDLGD